MTTIDLHHLPVTRTARYATLGSAGSAAEVWFVCHGYAQLAAPFLRHFTALDDGRRLLVAPEGLSRFYVDPEHARGVRTTAVGASWMTREDREHDIADYVGYLDTLRVRVTVGVPPNTPVTVLGFSQGVATACRWAALGREAVSRLILWAGDVPPDLDLPARRERLARARVVLVYGTRDRMIPERVREAAEERLRAAEIPYQVETYDGRHHIDARALERVAAGSPD